MSNKVATELVENEFIKQGFKVSLIKNSIYSIERNSNKYEIYVRSINYKASTNTYYPKKDFELAKDRYAVLVLFTANETDIYLIPSTEWITPSGLFADLEYVDGKSEPEWKLYINNNHFTRLDEYKNYK